MNSSPGRVIETMSYWILILILLWTPSLLAQLAPDGNPNPPNFPISLTVLGDLHVYRNVTGTSALSTTLSSGVNDSTLTIPVVDESGFQAGLIAVIESERVAICSVSTGVLTLCTGGRGFQGTTPAAHSSAIAVTAKTAAVTRISSAINATTTTIPVQDGEVLLADSIITIENERIKICTIAIDTLTACAGGRGFDGSLASAHPSLSQVRNFIVASSFNQAWAEIIAIEAELGITGSSNFYDLRTDENIGLHYMDIQGISVPANPASGTRRIFTNTATGALSVRTNAGTTVSLEAGGGGSPGGADTQLQYNNSGVFSGLSTLTTDGTNIAIAATAYTDIVQRAAPANPGAGTRRLFTDTATGELSVRTSAGATVSLEGSGGGGNSFGIIGVATADIPTDTLTISDSATIDFTTTNDPEDLTAIVIADSIGTVQVDETEAYVFSALGATTLTGGNLILNDGAGDSPQLQLVPASGTQFNLFVEDTTDDLRVTASTASTENVEFENTSTGLMAVLIETADGVLTDLKDAAHLTTGTVLPARVGADHLDAISEIAAGIKRGPDATDTHLLTTDVAAPAGLRCLQMDTDGSVVLDTDTCSNLGPGGTTTIDALGDAAGSGTVAVADFAQIWDWNSPATAAAKDAFTINYTLDASTDAAIQRVLRVVRPEAANTGVLEALLSIENLDTAAAVTAAIEIRSAAGGITSALDLNDAQITTLIEFTTGSISPSDLELLDDGTITLTTETTGSYAAGDGEAGAALTGDSATAFFSTGLLEVAIGGTGAATLTDGGPLLGSGTGAITALAQPTNGQLIIGSTGVDPVLATLTSGTGGEVSIANAAGSITLDITANSLDTNEIDETANYGWTGKNTNKVEDGVRISLQHDYSIDPAQAISAGANTITLTPCPTGVAGAHAFHYININDADDSPVDEAVLITGGTCTSELSSGTVQFVSVGAHGSGDYTLESASAGIQEAIWALVDDNSSGSGTVYIPEGVHILDQTLSIGDGTSTKAAFGTNSTTTGIRLVGAGRAQATTANGATIIRYSGPTSNPAVIVRGPVWDNEIREMQIDGNDISGDVLQIISSTRGIYDHLEVADGEAGSCGLWCGTDCNQNNFRMVRIRNVGADSDGLCIGLDETAVRGASQNVFQSIQISANQDEPTSYGLYIGRADNNTFSQINVFPNQTTADVGSSTCATPVSITTNSTHNRTTGDSIRMTGNASCDSGEIVDAEYVITVTGASTFTLDGTVETGTMTGVATIGGPGHSLYLDSSISALFPGENSFYNAAWQTAFVTVNGANAGTNFCMPCGAGDSEDRPTANPSDQTDEDWVVGFYPPFVNELAADANTSWIGKLSFRKFDNQTAYVNFNTSGVLELRDQTPLRLFEDDANGTNYIELLQPATVTSNRIVTLPDADSNTVQPLTCNPTTEKVSAISAAGVITCSTDVSGGTPAWEGLVNTADTATLYTSNNVLELMDHNFTAAYGASDIAAQWTQLTGNVAAGFILADFRAADSDAVVLRAGDGTNGITVSQAGALTAEGTGAITATLGDTATAFFGAGAIEAARGGTAIDSSALTGVVRVNSGTWSADAGISHLASSTSADLAGVISDERGTDFLVLSNNPTFSNAAGTSTITVETESSNAEVLIDSYGTSNVSVVRGRRARGDKGTPTAVLVDDLLLAMGGQGHDGSAFDGNFDVALIFRAAENFSGTNEGTYLTLDTTALAATARTERWRVDAAGALIKAFGGDPADTGDIALENADTICWEAAPAGADLCLSVNASEQLQYDNLDCSSGDQYITTTAGGAFICGNDDTAGAPTWDTIADPAAVQTITFGAVAEVTTFSFDAAHTADMFTIRQQTGNPTTGALLRVTASDTTIEMFKVDLASTDLFVIEPDSDLRIGDNTPHTLTFVAGASDPVLSLSSGIADWTTGVLQVGGSVVATAANTVTFTNKTFDANGTGNSISNIENADIAAAAAIAASKLANTVRDRKASFPLFDPTTADDGDVQTEFPAACTLQEVACNVQGGGTTVTVDLYERARATPDTGTTGMLTTPLVCDPDGAVTTSFTDAALAADVPLALGITAVSGTPTMVRVHVKCRTD